MASKFLGICTKLTQLGSIRIHQPYCIRCLAGNTPLTSLSFNSFCTSWKQRNNQTHLVSESNDLDVLYKRIILELKGHDPEVINSYEKFTSLAANELDVKISKITTPKRNIKRYTQLKSVHIFKKHRVQYEARTHYRIIELKHLTGSTADTYLEYIERNLPEGMAMKVTKIRLETIPDHIKQFIEPKVIQSSTDDSLT